ncbi:MAG: hypothetical protein IKJ35_00735 [Clostridia bacterium]|nr:hypothetical protein [Clostridia bacterium]
MKNQHKKTEARNFRFSVVAAVLLMLATLICCFTVVVSADVQRLEVGMGSLVPGSSLQLNASGDGYVKVYDGNTTADIQVDSAKVGISAIDLPFVELVIESAEFNSKDVADASKLTLKFKVQLTAEGVAQSRDDLLSKYAAPREQVFKAKIEPATLTWENGVVGNVSFVPGVTTYNLDVTAPALKGMVADETAPAITALPKATVTGVTGKGTYTTQVQAVIDSKNYVAAPLSVSVTVDPIVITSVQWDLPKTSFVWGDTELSNIAVIGFDAQDNPHALSVICGEGFGNAGTYTLTAAVPNANYIFGSSVSTTTSITINKKVFTVSFQDKTFFGNAELQSDPTNFMIAVEGDAPADVLSKITYTVNGTAFTGASAYGVYTVTANLPASPNYEFANEADGVMTAKMSILRKYVVAGNTAAPYQMILLGEKGFAGDITASVVVPEINRRALRGFRQHTAFTLNVSDAAGETFTVLIPISDTLYGQRLSALTAEDLYLYEDANQTLTSAKELGYTVTLKDGYYQIEGISGNAETTFVLAPEYNPPFFLTPLGIALLVLLVLALLALLFVIGLYLRGLRDKEENKILVIDTEGELPEAAEADKEPVDADAVLEENLEKIEETIEPADDEAEAEIDEAAIRAAVAEALAETFSDSAEDAFSPEDFKAVVDAIVAGAMSRTMELPEVAEAAETVDEKPADDIVVEELSNEDICAVVAASVAEAFEMITVDGAEPKAVEGTTVDTISEAVNAAGAENIPQTWSDEMADAVKEAIVEELAARLIVAEEPAVEAFVELVDEDEDDNDEEEEDYGGFGSMPLEFIDAVEEAEKYAAMLEEERQGLVRIVTRYKRSFQSRVSQSQGNVQEYYNIIKNALLSYKGVKNRISWNYEAFNRGRAHVAKINAKTKTLYLYLALDPAELIDTKYGIVDMSSKKKYATVPVLMKIKGDRKFKYALELIDKLCGEAMELPKLEAEEVDYRIPYQTTEELVQAGLVKKLVASIPVVYSENDATAAADAEPVEQSAAAEAQEVTFIAPTDTPAVEAAAEEIPASVEAPAETSGEETTEI